MSGSATTNFDYRLLLEYLGASATRFDVDWLPECDSTSTRLLERASQGAASGSVVGTAHQTAGRGRRGRSWLSAESCLMFSLLWRLPAKSPLEGLSLVIGLAVAHALEALGSKSIQLKWPNDVWHEGRKLAGILVEVTSPGNGIGLVIGIGLNLWPDPAWPSSASQSFTALSEVGVQAPREVVLAAVLQELARELDIFADKGFLPSRDAWCTRNALRGVPIRVSSDHAELLGVCGDVNATGALLLLRENSPPTAIIHGDVSVKPFAPVDSHVPTP
jgi:BirA family transcriptional regulator, biotin operon repressor / biotin---[acetyl-CoA-carboxylase] ligase